MKKTILITTVISQLTTMTMPHSVYAQNTSQQSTLKNQEALLVGKYKILEKRFGEAVALNLYNNLLPAAQGHRIALEDIKKRYEKIYKMEPIAYFKAGMAIATEKKYTKDGSGSSNTFLMAPSLSGDLAVQMVFHSLTGERSYSTQLSFVGGAHHYDGFTDLGTMENIEVLWEGDRKAAASLNIAANIVVLLSPLLYSGTGKSILSVPAVGLGSSVSSAHAIRAEDNKNYSQERRRAQINEFERFNSYVETEALRKNLEIMLPDAKDISQRISAATEAETVENRLVALFYDRPEILLRLGISAGLINSMENSLRENIREEKLPVPTISEMKSHVEAMQKFLVSEVSDRDTAKNLHNDLEKFKLLLK